MKKPKTMKTILSRKGLFKTSKEFLITKKTALHQCTFHRAEVEIAEHSHQLQKWQTIRCRHQPPSKKTRITIIFLAMATSTIITCQQYLVRLLGIRPQTVISTPLALAKKTSALRSLSLTCALQLLTLMQPTNQEDHRFKQGTLQGCQLIAMSLMTT